MFANLASLIPFAPGDPVVPDAGLTWLNTAPIMGLLSFAIVVIVAVAGIAIMLKSGRGDMKRSANSAGVIFIGLLVIGTALTAGLVMKLAGNISGSFFGG